VNANLCVEYTLHDMADQVGNQLDATPLAIVGPILGSLDVKVRQAVETIPNEKKKTRAAIILDTDGGVVEIVERMVAILRHHFAEMHFVVPDRAMSAGTIFAMSGDAIWMDYFACLGPIDPQIERDGKLVPALSYVVQFENLVRKS
jgi:ClpP class serine protease